VHAAHVEEALLGIDCEPFRKKVFVRNGKGDLRVMYGRIPAARLLDEFLKFGVGNSPSRAWSRARKNKAAPCSGNCCGSASIARISE